MTAFTARDREAIIPALRGMSPGDTLTVAARACSSVYLAGTLATYNERGGHGYFTRARQDNGDTLIRCLAEKPPRERRPRRHPPDSDERRRAISAAASREGRAAAMDGQPITACPFRGERQLPLAATWRNAWSAEKDRQLIARGVVSPVAYTTATGDEPRERPHRLSRGHAGGNPRGGKG